MQLTVHDLRALNLTYIGYQAVNQLLIGHFQREECHRDLIVSSNILGHGQRKRSLTHGGTSGNDNQVGGLPTGRNVIKFMIARSNARQAVLVGGGILDGIDGRTDDGVYLGVVLLHVALSQFEQGTLGLLHQRIDIDGLVEGHALDTAGIGDELARQRLLGHDAGVVLDISRRGYPTRQLCDVAGTTHVVEVALTGQLLRYRPYVDRVFVNGQVADSSENLLVPGFIETLGLQHVADYGIGILVNHERTQYGTLQVAGLRLHMGIGVVDGLLSVPAVSAAATAVILLFGHNSDSFGAAKIRIKYRTSKSFSEKKASSVPRTTAWI